jgi:uncharacterized OB-fold protein
VTEGEFDYSGVVPPTVGEETKWFDFCRNHQLMIQRCAACGQYQFPPRSVCVECLEEAPEWVEAAGTGSVFTFTIQHREAEGFAGQAPYTLAMVQLDEGPRIMSRIVGVGDVAIGMDVVLRWANVGADLDVPVFVAADPGSDAG